MPGFDGTGPRGMGPMTGGGRGRCNPYYTPNESADDGVLCSPIYEPPAVSQSNGSLDPLCSRVRGFPPPLFGPLPGLKEMAVVTERRK